MKKTGIIYWILGLAIIITVTFMGRVSVLYYIDFGSLLFTVGLGFVLSCVSHGAYDFFRAYRMAITGSKTEDITELRKALVIIYGFGKNILIVGALFTLTGGMAMLVSPAGDIERIGAGATLSLLTIFYSLVLILLFVCPFTNHLRAELAERE